MMYPYLSLNDGTENVHSEMLDNHSVKVYMEKADEKDGFHYATCFLPTYEWKDVFGFYENEIKYYQSIIENNAHLIMELSKSGGFEIA